MKQDLISVIIPVYKVEQYLDKCVESIVNQTYKNLEIILVNDGSPDNCPKMCENWAKKDKRIIVLNKENGGQGSARNLALDKCTGEYICFVDSDDWVDLNYIESLYDSIKQNNADISICGVREVYEDNTAPRILSKNETTEVFEQPELFEIAYKKQDFFCLAPWNKLYKKSLFKNIRFPEIRMYEDSAIYLNIFHAAKKMVISPIVTYNYLVRNQGTMRNSLTKIKIEGIFVQNELRLKFLENNNFNNLIYNEVARCLNSCFGIYKTTNDSELKKYIKEKYLDYRKKYKSILNFWNAPLKLKIKMIYLKIF